MLKAYPGDMEAVNRVIAATTDHFVRMSKDKRCGAPLRLEASGGASCWALGGGGSGHPPAPSGRVSHDRR